MEQNHASPQPPTTESRLNTAAEDRIPQTGQLPQIPPLWPALELKSNVVGTAVRPKAPMTRADWVNALWADISGQLRRLSVISSDLFDGLLLRRETATGSFLVGELVSLPWFALLRRLYQGMLTRACVCSARNTRSLVMIGLLPLLGFCRRTTRCVGCGSFCGPLSERGIVVSPFYPPSPHNSLGVCQMDMELTRG